MSNLFPDDWVYFDSNPLDEQRLKKEAKKLADEIMREKEIRDTLAQRELDKVLIVESTPGGTGHSYESKPNNPWFIANPEWAKGWTAEDESIWTGKKVSEDDFVKKYGNSSWKEPFENKTRKGQAGDGAGGKIRGVCPVCKKTIMLDIIPGQKMSDEQVYAAAQMLVDRHCQPFAHQDKVVSVRKEPVTPYGFPWNNNHIMTYTLQV